jgi:hypothetical protein
MRRILTTLLVAGLAGSGLAVAARPAYAAASISAVTVAPATVVVNGDSWYGQRNKITVKVYDPANETDGSSTSVETYAPGGTTSDFIFPLARTKSGSYAYFTGWIDTCGCEPPGRYRAHVEVSWFAADYSTSGTSIKDAYFFAKRPTSLTYNASPEPARRGSYLTHSGRLLFDPFAAGRYYGPRGVTLQLAFRATGASSYVAKGRIITGAGGYYTKRVLTSADGTWRITYAGSSTRAGQVKWDYVDTR